MATEAFCFCLQLIFLGFVSSDISSVYDGFLQANLSLDGASYVRSDGILAITNDTMKLLGHALYPSPLQFKENELNNKKKKNRSSVVTFSTNFVFSINPKYPDLGGHCLAFVLLSTKKPMGCLPNQYLGLPNDTSNAESTTRYCEEILFDNISNGSLDKILFDNHHKKKLLTWEERYKILIGIAQASLYLNEECDQRVVHRDMKPSNVLIDEDLNAKLGDFGLSRTSEHEINPQTTNIVGTLGYLAPELTKNGKATTSTDVYSYGALMIEVASGRRPIEPQKNAPELVLVDWVGELHSRGEIGRAVDPTLSEYNPDEAKLWLALLSSPS
uniref:non-specific serine/threonine protein kinase n=1 Tax=Davidia involucrata TaxID=16924 RepID=A0A5B7AI29_DAVIN